MRLDKLNAISAGLLPLLLIMGAQSNAASLTEHDPYAENVVRAALIDPSGPVYAFTEKALNRLGDRAAIGLIRLLGEQPALTADQIKRVIEFVRMSFGFPKIIGSDADRQP